MSEAYTAGRRAFISTHRYLTLEEQKNVKAPAVAPGNPYGINSKENRRTDWFDGYLDEWRWQKWGPNEDEKYIPLAA